VTESSEPATLAEVTAEIVAAYVSHNTIAPADVAALITSVAGQLARIGTEAEPPSEEHFEPAVPVRRSIHPDRLLCLVCGKAQKVLKRHLSVKHDLTPAGYRARYELRSDYPMIAPAYAQQRREVALKLGLGRPKPARGRRTGKPLGRPRKTALSQPAAPDAGA
jgi:MucR family transcriptional regulator, transcriptional regulator of exopolysaccharide biosynthesis